MALIKSNTALNQTFSGTFAGNKIPEELRVNGMDSLGQLSWLEKDMYSFNYFLHKRFFHRKFLFVILFFIFFFFFKFFFFKGKENCL